VRISEERTRTLQYQLTEALELLQGAARRAEEAAQVQRELRRWRAPPMRAR
jgi:hypothetical protein